MADTPQEIVDRELREYKRYTGDGQANEPVGAPLPVGDPASGVWNPKKANLRKAMLETLEGAEAQGNRAEAEADHSEEWAQSDDPISEAAGGDGATDRSSKWHADRSETAQGLSEDAQAASEAARDTALGYSNDALSSKTQAELAALAAGAPLFTSEPDLGTAPSPYLLQVEAGTQVYTHDGTDATMVGWLGKVEFPTVAALKAFTGPLGPVGTPIRADVYEFDLVDSDEHWETDGGVKLRVRRTDEGVLIANAFGSDRDAWQKAVDQGGTVLFRPGFYNIPTAIVPTVDVKLILNMAFFEGPGVDSGEDIFLINSETIKVSVQGGGFSGARWGFAVRRAYDFSLENGVFSDLACGIGVNVISGTPFRSEGTFSVKGSSFSDSETGVFLQSCSFKEVRYEGNTGSGFADKELSSRPYPLASRVTGAFFFSAIVAGTEGDVACFVTGNAVDGVTQITSGSSSRECHGLGVTLSDAENTDILMTGNIVKNVLGGDSAGCEGIMGRGRRVIISDCILFNAGAREGAIYAKGSKYHKIDNCTVEVSDDYLYADTARGVISTGTEATITNVKFIGLRIGIYTRALTSNIKDCEFTDILIPISMVLEANTDHVLTEVANCTTYGECGNLFTDGTNAADETITKGDVIIDGGTYTGFGSLFNVGKLRSLVVKGTKVRKTNGTTRDLMAFSGLVGLFIFNDNIVLDFSNDGESRLMTGATAFTPRIFAKGNHIEGGDTAFYLRDQTYVDLVLRDNDYFDVATPHNTTSMTVTGKDVRQDNVGVDL